MKELSPELKEEMREYNKESKRKGQFFGGFFLCIFTMAVIALFLSGCAIGAKKTTQEYGQAPDIIIHKYDYTVRPAPTPPRTPPLPLPPTAAAPPVDYQTIYSSAYDDPSLVVFNNKTYRNVKIAINGKSPISLGPYQSTSNIHLGLGEHKTVVEIEKPTAAHGIWTVTRLFTISIRPEGRSQIFNIYDRGYYWY